MTQDRGRLLRLLLLAGWLVLAGVAGGATGSAARLTVRADPLQVFLRPGPYIVAATSTVGPTP